MMVPIARLRCTGTKRRFASPTKGSCKCLTRSMYPVREARAPRRAQDRSSVSVRYITPIAGDYRVEIALNDALDCEVDEATLNDLALNMVLEINHLRAQLVAAKSRQSRGSVRELRGRLAAGLRRVIMPLHRPASVILEYIPESSPIAAASEVVRDMLQSQMASIERILEADVGSAAVSAASARLHMSKLAQRWKTFLNPRNTSFTVTVWPAPMQ